MKRKTLTLSAIGVVSFLTSISSATETNIAPTYSNLMFTTDAYKREALRLVIREANQVAQELRLAEELPITESNLAGAFIPPYGMSQFTKIIGTVTTGNYTYCVSVDFKFSYLEGTRQDAHRSQWSREYSWPISQLDTNAAYQLATQWLGNVSMDVEGLNRDCKLHIRPAAITGVGDARRFLPLYSVYWTRGPEGYGSVAYVEIFLPTKTLVELRVEDSKYILRKPLQFTNLDYLLSQTNTLVQTNAPAA